MRRTALVVAIVTLTVPLAGNASYLSGEDVSNTASPDDGFNLEFEISSPPTQGESTTLIVEVEKERDSIEDAQLNLSVSDNVEVRGDAHRQLSLEDERERVAFEIAFTGPGLAEMKATASEQADGLGSAEGVGISYADVPETGEGEFYPESPPIPDGNLSAVPVDGESDAEREDEDAQAASRLLNQDQDLVAPEELPDGTLPPGEAGPATSHTFQVKACWNFKDTSGSVHDQRWAQIEVMDSDDLDDDLLWSGETGSDGCFLSGSIDRSEECCLKGNQDVYIRFIMENSHVMVDRPDAGRYVYATNVDTVGDNEDVQDWGEQTTGEGHIGARQFQYGNNAWDWGDNYAYQSVSWKVDIEAPSTSCSDSSIACYDESEDRIHIPDEQDGKPDITGHEYGHFFMDKHYPNLDLPGGSHSLCGDNQDRFLSWSEGFASFYGTRVNYELGNDGVPGADGDTLYDGADIEDTHCTDGSGNVVQGDDNEWNIARTLWDIVDSADDGESSTHSDYRVAEVVDDCEDDSLRDYYDQGCSWVDHGYSASDWEDAASNNYINY